MSESPNNESPNGDTVKKSLALVGAATAFVIGGFGITQLASAQTTDEEPTVEESDDIDADSDADTDDDADTGYGDDADAEDGDSNRRGRKGDCGEKHEAIAEMLGLTTDEVRAEIEAGNSLADIAEANGVDSQDLVDLMVAQATERVEAKVEAGDITEAEATEKLADAEERAEEKVNSTDGFGDRGRRGNRGERGDRDGAGETEDTNADSVDA